MNAFLLVTVVALVTINVSGQGQIFFNNRVVGVVVAPVYGANPSNPTVRLSGNATTNGGTVNYAGYPLISGTGWTAQLWYGPEGSSMNALQPVTSMAGTVPFRSLATTAGFIQSSAAAATLNGIPFGDRATLQMRVWDNQAGTITSWAQVLAYGALSGFSDIFTSPVLLAPPDTPPYLVGLTSFSISYVPEPTVVTVGALGFAALLLRRRKGITRG